MPLTDFVRKGTLHRRDVDAPAVAVLVKEASQQLSIASTLKAVDAGRDDYAYGGVVKLATALLGAAGYHASHKTDDLVLLNAVKRILPDQKKFVDLAEEWSKRRTMVAKKKSWPVEAGEADAQLESAWMFRTAVISWLKEHCAGALG